MIFLYNKTTLSFRKKILALCQRVLNNEMNISTTPSYFLYNNYHYPLSIHIFETSKRTLALFNSSLYALQFNKRLMFEAQDNVLLNIIRHELAHYICFIDYPHIHEDKPHGELFKKICSRFQWGEEVSNASVNIKLANEKILQPDFDKLTSKIKKLLNLSSSSNENESQLAILKANKLLTRHNLKNINNDDEGLCSKRVLEYKRFSQKIQAIYTILETFNIQPIINSGRGKSYLEVIGPKVNVELCEYITHFLFRELEYMWEQNKKKHPHFTKLKYKNAFFQGIADGYIAKEETFQSKKDKKLIDINLKYKLKTYYGSLRKTKNYESFDQKKSLVKEMGKSAGKQLILKAAIKNETNKCQTYFLSGP